MYWPLPRVSLIRVQYCIVTFGGRFLHVILHILVGFGVLCQAREQAKVFYQQYAHTLNRKIDARVGKPRLREEKTALLYEYSKE